jgi:hypothetical protein
MNRNGMKARKGSVDPGGLVLLLACLAALVMLFVVCVRVGEESKKRSPSYDVAWKIALLEQRVSALEESAYGTGGADKALASVGEGGDK